MKIYHLISMDTIRTLPLYPPTVCVFFSLRNGEERGEMDVFAGYVFFLHLFNQELPDFGMPILLTINIEQKNIIRSNTNYQLLENLTEIVDLSNVLTFAEE